MLEQALVKLNPAIVRFRYRKITAERSLFERTIIFRKTGKSIKAIVAAFGKFILLNEPFHGDTMSNGMNSGRKWEPHVVFPFDHPVIELISLIVIPFGREIVLFSFIFSDPG